MRCAEPGARARVGRELSARKVGRVREARLAIGPGGPECDGQEGDEYVELHVVGVVEAVEGTEVAAVEDQHGGDGDGPGERSGAPLRALVAGFLASEKRSGVPPFDANNSGPQPDEHGPRRGEVIGPFRPIDVARVEDDARDPGDDATPRVRLVHPREALALGHAAAVGQVAESGEAAVVGVEVAEGEEDREGFLEFREKEGGEDFERQEGEPGQAREVEAVEGPFAVELDLMAGGEALEGTTCWGLLGGGEGEICEVVLADVAARVAARPEQALDGVVVHVGRGGGGVRRGVARMAADGFTCGCTASVSWSAVAYRGHGGRRSSGEEDESEQGRGGERGSPSRSKPGSRHRAAADVLQALARWQYCAASRLLQAQVARLSDES